MRELTAKMQQIADEYQQEAEEFDAEIISGSDGKYTNIS